MSSKKTVDDLKQDSVDLVYGLIGFAKAIFYIWLVGMAIFVYFSFK